MLWQPWEASRADILQAARPIAELQQRFSAQSALIDNAIASTGRPAEALRSLPLITRKPPCPWALCRWIRFEPVVRPLPGCWKGCWVGYNPTYGSKQPLAQWIRALGAMVFANVSPLQSAAGRCRVQPQSQCVDDFQDGCKAGVALAR